MKKAKIKTCRICGCTDNNCKQCIEKTGQPCSWIEKNLCSACLPDKDKKFLFLLMDYRAKKDPWQATCFEFCDTIEEARENRTEYGDDTLIVRYEQAAKNEIINPLIIPA